MESVTADLINRAIRKLRAMAASNPGMANACDEIIGDLIEARDLIDPESDEAEDA
jgi:hypothetical protein